VHSVQMASHNRALPQYYFTQVVNYGWLSNEDRILAHFRDHFISIITCMWTPLEEQVTNIICGWFRLVAKLRPIL
jgi:hypothetical protein